MASPERAAADPARVAEVFAEVLERTPTERSAFLDATCASDLELRAEIESLLRAHEGANGFLEHPDSERGVSLLEATVEPEVAGRRVGPYGLIRELGRGGMGVVYLAERAEGGFAQRVAIKLIKRGMDTDAILQRFLRERQILAALEHPNVARLFDGGVTEDGQPYFAMEYVEGRPLTEHCSEGRLSIEERLRLVEEACRAVQHAHGKLVVHRDLKPSNMMITPQGQLKLLDFGVAKLLADGPEGGYLTETGIHPLTPEYASPEQVRGEPVTTATDVYALGLVLYELLTGRRPFGGKDWSREALAKATCETEPVPPSAAIVAEPRLARRLRGDLDAVVLRALRKEPPRRYASAEALAEDIRRHLAGQPVQARPDSVRYRAAKFVRRHRVGVAAAGVTAASLLLGLISTAWQAERARREAQRAGAVQRFLVGIFESADPARSLGETITAQQLLEEGARRLRSGPAADPAAQAELADTLARTYRSLGRLDQASTWSREAITGFGRALDAGHPRAALAELTEAEVRLDRGDVAHARSALEALLPRLRRAYSDGSPEHLRGRAARAALLVHTGELEAALAERQAVFEGIQKLYGNDHVETATRLGDVADTLGSLSRFPEAEKAFRDALARVTRAGAASSPQSVHLQTSLADVLETAHRRDEAEVLFRSALETGRSVLGVRHPQVAQILIKYGFLNLQRGRYAEAETMLAEAIGILEPLGHYDAGAALNYMAVPLLRRERFAEARDVLVRAEGIVRAKLGDDDPLTWKGVVEIAYADARLGKVAAAEPRLREAIAALERLHGPDNNDVRAPKKLLGEVLRMAGRFEEAEAMHRWALDLERGLFGGDENRAAAATKYQLALDLLDSGRAERMAEARRYADESLAFVRTHESEPWRLGDILGASGRIAAAQGDVRRARRDLTEALELLVASRGEDAPSARRARQALARLGGTNRSE